MAKTFKAITKEKILKISTFSLQKIDLVKIAFSSPASKKRQVKRGIKINGYFGYLEGIQGNLKKIYPLYKIND